jgi:hypothetical protein
LLLKPLVLLDKPVVGAACWSKQVPDTAAAILEDLTGGSNLLKARLMPSSA